MVPVHSHSVLRCSPFLPSSHVTSTFRKPVGVADLSSMRRNCPHPCLVACELSCAAVMWLTGWGAALYVFLRKMMA